MCKFCESLEYRDINVPTRTSMADDNICEIASPHIENIDGEEFKYGVICDNCMGCMDENNYFSITTWEDNLCLNYYHKVKDVVIAPISARFSINFCPMCGKRISKDNYYEDLKFW